MVGKNGVDAGLRRWWINKNLGLAVFVCNLGVVIYDYAAEGLAIGGDTVLKDAIVGGVGDGQQSQDD